MSFSQNATFDYISSVLFSDISTTYTSLGSITHLTRLMCLTNLTDGDMLIAYTNGTTPLSNGTQDNLVLPAGGFKLFDIATNRVKNDSSLILPKGGKFWVRYSTAPTRKSVYLETMYGVGE